MKRKQRPHIQDARTLKESLRNSLYRNNKGKEVRKWGKEIKEQLIEDPIKRHMEEIEEDKIKIGIEEEAMEKPMKDTIEE